MKGWRVGIKKEVAPNDRALAAAMTTEGKRIFIKAFQIDEVDYGMAILTQEEDDKIAQDFEDGSWRQNLFLAVCKAKKQRFAYALTWLYFLE